MILVYHTLQSLLFLVLRKISWHIEQFWNIADVRKNFISFPKRNSIAMFLSSHHPKERHAVHHPLDAPFSNLPIKPSVCYITLPLIIVTSKPFRPPHHISPSNNQKPPLASSPSHLPPQALKTPAALRPQKNNCVSRRGAGRRTSDTAAASLRGVTRHAHHPAQHADTPASPPCSLRICFATYRSSLILNVEYRGDMCLPWPTPLAVGLLL